MIGSGSLHPTTLKISGFYASKIKLLNKTEKKDILGRPVIKYEAFFTNTGRNGSIDAKDISGLWEGK